jgi:uncharacterized protein YkwD
VFAPGPPPLNNDSAAAAQLIGYINQVRAQAGCGSLGENGSLDTAAVRHSNDMANHNFFSQMGSDGSTPGQRDAAAGMPSGRYGENIAQGGNAQQVLYGWMRDSSSTRQNMLNCGFATIGVGVDTQGWYWTADFGE